MTTEQIQKIVDGIDTNYSLYDWNGTELFVRPIIDFTEFMKLVRDIVHRCTDKKTGTFVPEMLDFATKVMILVSYTDIALPKRIEDQYTLIYGTTLYDDVLEVISKSQVEAVRSCIDLIANNLIGSGHN